MKTQQINLTEGPIGKGIVRFAVPLLAGNLFQQLYNTVDSLIVGNYLGHQSLAAVSATSNLIYLMVGFMNGLAIGAGVVIARQFGAKKYKEMQVTIHTLVAFGLIAGLVLSLVGVVFSRNILAAMNTPENVLDDAANYFRIYFAGIISLVMYNIFASILQAVGNSRDPLFYLMVSSGTNVFLDILFIRFVGWDVWAAAFATILSQSLSAILCFTQLLRSKEQYGIRIKSVRLDTKAMKEIIRFGLPSGLQNSVIGISNVLIQSQINIFGDVAVAGCGAYHKIEGFGLMPMTTLALALTTYVSQNMGAGKSDRVKKGARFTLLFSMTLAEVIGVILFAAAPVLVAAFNGNRQVIEIGTEYARIVSLFFFLPACTHGIAAIFRGKGKPFLSMSVILICWCVIRVIFLMTTLHFLPKIQVIFWTYPLTWLLSTVVFVVLYKIEKD